MSNFIAETRHPKTGVLHKAEWLDNHFGRHVYGIRFPGGEVFRECELIVEPKEFHGRWDK